jgi:hypothetical protein
MDLIQMTHPDTQTPAPRLHEAVIEAQIIMARSKGIQSLCYIVRVAYEDRMEIDLVEIDREAVIHPLWRFTDLSQ